MTLVGQVMERNRADEHLLFTGFWRHVWYARFWCFTGIAGLGLGLSGCQMFVPDANSSPTELSEALTEYNVVPAARAFVNVPDALLVLERDLGIATEQRITLPNPTSLSGENILMIRAQTQRASSPSNLILQQVLAQFGGPPAPFANVTDTSLSTLSDQVGAITYTTLRPGGDIICVLALRRSRIGARSLPRGTSSLDFMLRNCVSGSLEAALEPIGARAFALGQAN